jgi:hypothetical protein
MAFETFLEQGATRPRHTTWRRATYALSLSLHAALLMGMLARSYWVVDELQPPGVQVSLRTLPPPPPPPPPAPPKAAAADAPKLAERVRPKNPPPPTKAELRQPEPAKPEPPAEDPGPTASETDEGPGEVGGVAGGVAGGVVDNVPPPPAVVAAPEPPPVMLPPNVGVGQRLSDLTDPRFRPDLPPTLKTIGSVVWGLFRICVAATGKVKEVAVLKSADPLVDDKWMAVIGRWEYRPYSVAGRPVPFCHATRIEVRTSL